MYKNVLNHLDKEKSYNIQLTFISAVSYLMLLAILEGSFSISYDDWWLCESL